MMTFAQYLLSKVAEEAVEFAKEVLKGQQQGLYSDHRGMRNIDYIRAEFIDLYARASVLEKCSEFDGGELCKFELLPIRLEMTESNMLDVDASIAKMCHYALMAFNNSHLWLTSSELKFVEERAEWYKEILAMEELTKEK
jgi:hypothetical protein